MRPILLARRGSGGQVIIPSAPGDYVITPPVGPFTPYDGGQSQESNGACFARGDGVINLSKLSAKNYTGYGIGSMQYYPPSNPNPGLTTLRDCIADNIHTVPPDAMDGQGEAGFWFGNKTDAARFKATNCSWMGMWTGSYCHDSIFTDFVLDTCTHVGLYVEHVTENCTFQRFDIQPSGTGNSQSIIIEWWYGGAGSSHNLFQDGRCYCPPKDAYEPNGFGVFVDAGGFANTFRNITFWGPGDAIGLPNNLAGVGANVVENCTFLNSGRQIVYHDRSIG